MTDTVHGDTIRLLLADVDGTLLDPDKFLTDRARAAIDRARRSGLIFALTSGRPPRGMRDLAARLALDTPIAGFNGGVIVAPDFTVLRTRLLDPALARAAIALLPGFGLDVWAYDATAWYVTDPAAPHVAREQATVGFAPEIRPLAALDPDGIVKLVGVTDDAARMSEAEATCAARLGEGATVATSQPYYLDITDREANKGGVVAYLAERYGISPRAIATIGDQANDVRMFRRAGIGIAMGQASAAVREAASRVTDDNAHDGFAHALETLLDERNPRS